MVGEDPAAVPRERPKEPRPTPNYILAAYMASGSEAAARNPRQLERSRCQPHERGAGAGRTARPLNPSTLTAGQRLAYSARCRRVRRATPVSTSTTPPMARAQSPVPTPV